MDVSVRFLPSGRRLRVPVGTTLLEAARLAGLPVASACGAEGLCARCGMQILVGGGALPAESEAERRVKADNQIDSALRLSCLVELRHEMEATAPYW